MTSTTHLIISAISVTTIDVLRGEPFQPLQLAVAGIASLLPDIDLPQSRIGRLWPKASEFIFRKVGHRTLTHSIFGWLIAAVVFLPFKWVDVGAPLYRAAMIGYISHACIDLSNIGGVALTYPIAPHHRWVLPAVAERRIPVNSEGEQALRFIGVVILSGLLLLQSIGSRTIFHNFLGTSDAIAAEHYHHLMTGNRLVVRIRGIWTKGQGKIDAEFDVIASTDSAIFVRHRSEPLKIYQVGHGEPAAIAHSRLQVMRRIPAEQRIFTIHFDHEKWKPSLANEYPNALITGSLFTRAKAPSFGIDEFATIEPFAHKWELTHAPIELVDQRLKNSNARISGEIQLRYWRDKLWKDTTIFKFPLNF